MRPKRTRYPFPADTYCVDATNGLDTNTGSADNPLKTVAAVNALVLRPGNRVLWAGGQTFGTTQLVLQYAGLRGRPIVFGKYGSGADPIFAGAGDANACIRIQAGAGNLRFKNIATANAATTYGLYMVNVTTQTVGLEFEDCDFGACGSTCVHMNGGSAIGLRRIRFTRCVAHNGGQQGFHQYGTSGIGTQDVEYVSCTSRNNGSSSSLHQGWYVSYSDGTRILDCISYSNAAHGFQLQDGNINALFKNFASYLNGGLGMWYTGQALGSNCSVVNGLIYSNVSDGIAVGATTRAGLFYHNSLVNNNTGASGGALNLSAGVSGCAFKNNILFMDYNIGGDSKEPVRCATATEVSANTWNNNCVIYLGHHDTPTQCFRVVSGTGLYTLAQWQALTGTPDLQSISAHPLFVGVAYTTVDADSNSGQAVLNVTSTAGFNPGDVVCVAAANTRNEFLTILSVQAGVSLTMTGNIVHSHSAANADTVHSCVYTNLHLQSTSTCIGAGDATVGVLTDYDSVLRGAAVDIGCYEYVA